MDVRCEKCSTEYEFDDSRITDAGVTVRCTTCGFIFKVKRRGQTSRHTGDEFTPEMTSVDKTREWKIRQANGSVFTCRELTTLQKWIVERKVGRSDEISLSGDAWKRLGDIPELANFFLVVDQATKAELYERNIGTAGTVASMPAGSYQTIGTPSGMATPLQVPVGVPAAMPYQSGVYPDRPPPPVPSRGYSENGHSGQFEMGRGMNPNMEEPAWTNEPDSEVGEEDEDLKAIRGGSGKWIAAGVILGVLAAGGYVATVLFRHPPAPAPAPAENPVPPTPTPAPVAATPAAPTAPVPAPAPAPVPTAGTAAPGSVPGAPAPTGAVAAPLPGAAPVPTPTPAPSPGAALPSTNPLPPAPGAEPVAAVPVPPPGPTPAPTPKPADAAVKPADAAPPAEPKARSLDSLLAEAHRLHEKEKTQAALKDYQQAIDIAPDSAEAWSGKGQCLIDLERATEAETAFRKALKYSSEFSDAQIGLAESLKYQGKKAEAIKYYKIYLDAHPSGDDAALAKRAVQELSE